MQRVDSIDSMQRLSRRVRLDGKPIALVPTMGFLHEGHFELVRRARRESDFVVVSIFVNPTQFGPGEDLDQYPRDLDRDLQGCRENGADVVFCPADSTVYAPDHSTYVDEDSLSKGLCGTHRPSHFRGVTTVVAKLFNIVQPDVAVFGQKDAQQVAVIQRMVRDLNVPVHILIEPIVREPDGLAMSSRNTYLSPAERAQALWLNRTLCAMKNCYREGECDSDRLQARMLAQLAEHAPDGDVEYISFVNRHTLLPVDAADDDTLVALAVKVGATRLIDNTILGE